MKSGVLSGVVLVLLGVGSMLHANEREIHALLVARHDLGDDTEEWVDIVRRNKAELAEFVLGRRSYGWLGNDQEVIRSNRGSALVWLGKIEPAIAVGVARTVLREVPHVEKGYCLHEAALSALGYAQGQSEAGPVLVRGLEDALRRGSGAECEAALRSLGQIHYRAAVPTLKTCLTSAVGEARYFGAITLGELGGSEAAQMLREHLAQHPDESLGVVRQAVAAIGKIGGADLLSFVMAYGQHSDARVRELAEKAVQAIRKRAGLPPPAPPKGSLGFQPLKTLPAGATTLLAPATGAPR